MIWTYSIKYEQHKKETIISILKNNRMYVSVGFGHLSKNSDDRLVRITTCLYDYGHKILDEVKDDAKQVLQVNTMISELLMYVVQHYPDI